MKRMVVTARVGSDGILHLHLPVGETEADTQGQVTVETAPAPSVTRRSLTASEFLRSGLVGMWAERSDIGDSREFARRLREEAQTRRQGP